MSLSEEKVMILKMLQEGKISTEDAAKLLEALEGASKQAPNENTYSRPQRPQATINYNDEIAKLHERINQWKNDFKKNYNEKDFDRMVDEFSTKAEKIGKNVASTTAGFVDKMIDFVGTVVDTGSFNIFGGLDAVEKTFEADAREGMDIDVEGLNGQIYVKKNTEDKILIKTKIRTFMGETDNVVSFANTENTVSVKVNKSANLSISHEIYLPAVRYNKIKFETTNARIYVEDALSNELACLTKNSSIDLMGVTGDKIYVDTKNARISLSYVSGKDISINTKNSVIEVKNVKLGKLKAETSNGKIFVENVQFVDDSNAASLALLTKNAHVKVNMNDMDSKSYKVRARTTNGRINLLIPELLYHTPGKNGHSDSYVEAETSGYEDSLQKVDINVETTNGYVEIVK